MKKLLLFALILISSGAVAQIVAVKKVELAGDIIIVHYELDDGNPNNEYQLDLYSSIDNFAAPLKKVKGDVGDEIKPGLGKKIEWNVREEMGGYKGRIALEVRGKVYIPFARLQNFDNKKGYKRGKSYNLTWKPGNVNPLNIELYKGGERIGGENNHPNNGTYTLFIPAKAKPGKDYRLKVSDAKNTSDVIYTSYFKVTPKVPLLVKILPVVVVGGVVAFLVGGGDPPPDDPGGSETGALPVAPNPGN